MATLNLGTIEINDSQMLSDVQAVWENYDGETYAEKARNYLKKKTLLDVEQKRKNEHYNTFVSPTDIEI